MLAPLTPVLSSRPSTSLTSWGSALKKPKAAAAPAAAATTDASSDKTEAHGSSVRSDQKPQKAKKSNKSSAPGTTPDAVTGKAATSTAAAPAGWGSALKKPSSGVPTPQASGKAKGAAVAVSKQAHTDHDVVSVPGDAGDSAAASRALGEKSKKKNKKKGSSSAAGVPQQSPQLHASGGAQSVKRPQGAGGPQPKKKKFKKAKQASQ